MFVKLISAVCTRVSLVNKTGHYVHPPINYIVVKETEDSRHHGKEHKFAMKKVHSAKRNMKVYLESFGEVLSLDFWKSEDEKMLTRCRHTNSRNGEVCP